MIKCVKKWSLFFYPAGCKSGSMMTPVGHKGGVPDMESAGRSPQKTTAPLPISSPPYLAPKSPKTVQCGGLSPFDAFPHPSGKGSSRNK
ncbi:hypothetical protein CDAR_435681 [Caerostris darwini]|uniref:Uncharacterized protein n=1 Tax=Caerostris darwini TaxID=1538125 RepID=A0AAV4P9W0_9ARAC|nr:hypothetical protein CDAR_435681 [Caerostris darwini]